MNDPEVAQPSSRLLLGPLLASDTLNSLEKIYVLVI
jgi:hypothetical protein